MVNNLGPEQQTEQQVRKNVGAVPGFAVISQIGYHLHAPHTL